MWHSNTQIRKLSKCSGLLTVEEKKYHADYELTKARLYSKMYGPGAALPKIRRQYGHKLPPETIAFVLEFIHHLDSEEYSSCKSGPCDGKQKSWMSELLGGGNQPVLWFN